MSKFLLIPIILQLFILSIFTPIINAASCPVANPATDVIVVSFQPSVRQPIEVAMTFNMDQLSTRHEYQLLVSDADFRVGVGADDAYSDWITYDQINTNGAIPIDPNKRSFRTYQFSTTTHATRLGPHRIKLRMKPIDEIIRSEEVACNNLGDINLIDLQLIKTDCTMSLSPGRVQVGKPFNINISFGNPPQGYNYKFYILKRSASDIPDSSQIGPFEKVIAPLTSGVEVFSLDLRPTAANPLIEIVHFNDDQSHNNKTYPSLKTTGSGGEIPSYAGAVVVSKNEGRGTFGFFCGKFPIEVTNADTSSEPPLIVTPQPPPGTSTSAPGSSGCVPGQNCTSASGEFCDASKKELQTAIGCIPTDPTEFIRAILRFSVAIGGGLAFLLMVLGAFQMITSAGNPETLKAGQERFASAIIGLLFIVFSVLLLRIIGVDILGFGRFFGLPQ